ACGPVPHTDFALPPLGGRFHDGSRRDPVTVGAESHTQDCMVVAAQRGDLLTRAHVPNLDQLVVAAAGTSDKAAIRPQGNVVPWPTILVGQTDLDLAQSPTGGVPHVEEGAMDCDQAAAVVGEGDGAELFSVTWDNGPTLPARIARQVPDAHRSI